MFTGVQPFEFLPADMQDMPTIGSIDDHAACVPGCAGSWKTRSNCCRTAYPTTSSTSCRGTATAPRPYRFRVLATSISVERHFGQARPLDSESTSGGNGHMIRNSPEIIWMPRQRSLPAKFVSGGFLLGAVCRRSVPNAKRQSPRITQPVISPDAICRASRQKFAMPHSPTNP
jgi:hypothetical protein